MSALFKVITALVFSLALYFFCFSTADNVIGIGRMPTPTPCVGVYRGVGCPTPTPTPAVTGTSAVPTATPIPTKPVACIGDKLHCPDATPTPTITGTGAGITGVPSPTRASASAGKLPPGGAGVTCDPLNGNADNPPNPNHKGIYTAIGCISTEPTEFIRAVSQLATGAGGGIALLLMIAGVFRMMTSAGNPDAVKAGSEQFTSALIGLLFIIFAVLLLKVIGVDILNIPGFG